MRLIFLGPPGSGKGTQAKILAAKLGLTHLSTGEILRTEIAQGSELGRKAKKYMDAGALVPDELILEMIKDILQKSPDGFIFDGFPRTAPQAKGLDELLRGLGMQIDAALFLSVSDAILISRLQGRFYCPKCGLDFNVNSRPPAKAGICDNCGDKLRQRSDDTDEVIKHRLEVYHKQTRVVEDYYRNQGLLIEIDGSQPPDKVTASVVNAVG
jgi:adenylate kinase